MARKFIPQYDVKLRGGKIITEWRYGAHPVLHAIPQALPEIPKDDKKAKILSNIAGGTEALSPKPGGGTVWSDKNTKHVKKPLPSIRRKSTDEAGEDKEFTLTETQELSLKNELRRTMQEMKDKDIKGILPNFRALDNARVGRLRIDQVKFVLQTHKILLGEGAYRNLFKKFGQMHEREHLIKYDEMMPYFSKIYAEAAALPPPPKSKDIPAAGFTNGPSRLSYANNSGGSYSLSNRSYQSSYSNSYQAAPAPGVTQQIPRILNMRNKVMFQDRDEAKLLLDIQRELQDQPVKMTDLRNIMYYLDPDRNNFLNATQVQDAIQRCGAYLSAEVFSRLLLASDRTGAGLYPIETIISYLSRASPETHYHIPLGMNHNPRRARAAVLPALIDQPTYQIPYIQPATAMEPHVDYLSDYDEQSYPYESYLDSGRDSNQVDLSRWSSDFRCLVDALNQADPNRTGYLLESEAARITNNYSLVYNLGISTATLNTALEKAFDHTLKEINKDHFVSCLEQLHLQAIVDS